MSQTSSNVADVNNFPVAADIRSNRVPINLLYNSRRQKSIADKKMLELTLVRRPGIGL